MIDLPNDFVSFIKKAGRKLVELQKFWASTTRKYSKFRLFRAFGIPKTGQHVSQQGKKGPLIPMGNQGATACRKSPADFPAKLRKISTLVAQVPKFCDSDAKENPDGFLSHYLSLRNLWSKRFFDRLRSPDPHGESGDRPFLLYEPQIRVSPQAQSGIIHPLWP